MRFSRLFVPTMREIPSDVEAVCHKLMLRAGFVRQLASGLFIFLPLGWRVLNKVNTILEEEMERIGAQEVTMPILHPAEIWQQTGRWYDIKEEMFRLKDRTGRDMCLGMTHEEIMTWLAAKEIRSYRELPQMWYQIQTKLRDEARPRGGLLRTREFIMKDSYSFDIDEEGLETSYSLHAEAYHRIFSRCGLDFYQVESDPGMMGGATAHEFMAPSSAGEDRIVICSACGYIANTEIAVTVAHGNPDLKSSYEEIYTPQKRTIKEVSDYLNISPCYLIKSLLLIAVKGPVLVLIRGDHELHEKKVTKVIGPYRTATKEEIYSILGVDAGFIGPMNSPIPVVADNSLKTGCFVAGANRNDFHAKGVSADMHFSAAWHDLHMASEGEKCPKCNALINIIKVIEIGNIFKLGTKYSRPLNAVFLDRNGEEKPLVMGSYGIGPARIAAAAIEQNHDQDGIVWPHAIAPFDIEILPLNVKDPETNRIAESLYRNLSDVYNSLTDRHMEVLLDDRDVRPGVKFKDADLIGIPLQVVIGERTLREGKIEIRSRRTKESLKTDALSAIPAIVGFYLDLL